MRMSTVLSQHETCSDDYNSGRVTIRGRLTKPAVVARLLFAVECRNDGKVRAMASKQGLKTVKLFNNFICSCSVGQKSISNQNKYEN
jgi:hypothetical protein